MQARAIVFSSSRTLPFHGLSLRNSIASAEMLDYMSRYYVPGPGYRGPAEVEAALDRTEPLIQNLRSRCTQLFGEAPVNIRLVDKIDYSAGNKFRIVESHVKR
jgi:hypothetical protein